MTGPIVEHKEDRLFELVLDVWPSEKTAGLTLKKPIHKGNRRYILNKVKAMKVPL